MTTIIKHVSTNGISSGVVDIRSPEMTLTPNAALFFASGHDLYSSNALDNPGRLSYGFAAKRLGSISQGAAGIYSGNGEASTDNATHMTSDACVVVLNGILPSTYGVFTDFLDNNGLGAGVRLTFSAAADAVITVVLIHCPDAMAGFFDASGSVGGTNAVEVGFSPNVVMLLNGNIASGDFDTTNADMLLSFGAADDNLNQRCYTIAEENGQSAGDPVFQGSNNRVASTIDLATGAVTTAWEVTSYTGLSFVVTQRTGTDTPRLLYLALNTGSSRVSVIDIASRTSAGTQTVNVGFRPQAIIHSVSRTAAWNSGGDVAQDTSMGVNVYGSDHGDPPPIFGQAISYEPQHTGIVIGYGNDPTETGSSTSTSLNSGEYRINSYELDNTPEAMMRHSILHNGFSLVYASAPAAVHRWWAIVVQEDTAVRPPYTSRMYSLLHGLSLSMVVRQSPLSVATAPVVDSLAYRMTGYSHEIAADGGYMGATLSFPAQREEIAEWLEYGVGREFAAYNEGQQLCYLGVIDSVDSSIGGVSFNSGSLTDVANRVAVAYRRQTYDIPGLDVGGQERLTDYANDTDSQALFGIMSAILNGGETSSTIAESLRDSFLAELAQLRPTQNYSYQANSGSTVTLNCIGYYQLLDRFLYEATGGGTMDADEKVRDVLASDPNALFSSASPDIDTNTYQVRNNEDGQASGLSVIRATSVLGDSSNNRWIAGALHNRRFFFRSIPTTPELMVLLSDAGALLRNVSGNVVHPWNATPGKWLVMPDISLSRVFPFNSTTTIQDRRSIFVESVQYTAPYGLQIGGGRANNINQRLAKLGLGGI